MTSRIVLITVAVAATASGVGCVHQQPMTAVGKETDAILPKITGYVVMEKPAGGMIAIQLPTLKEIVIRPTLPPGRTEQLDFPTVHAVSGPDEEGRIAYI